MNVEASAAKWNWRNDGMSIELKEPGRGPERGGSGKSRMMCPVCEVSLSMADRQGIEIDFCPECRGVWLDRGELDKIIERSIGEQQTRGRRDDDDDDYRYGGHGGGHGGHGGRYGGRGHRRRSWLHELFD